MSQELPEKDDGNRERVNFDLPDELIERVDQIAERIGTPVRREVFQNAIIPYEILSKNIGKKVTFTMHEGGIITQVVDEPDTSVDSGREIHI